VLSLSTGFFYA